MTECRLSVMKGRFSVLAARIKVFVFTIFIMFCAQLGRDSGCANIDPCCYNVTQLFFSLESLVIGSFSRLLLSWNPGFLGEQLVFFQLHFFGEKKEEKKGSAANPN